MRYAIVSDIHANQQAWNAVWLDIRSSNIDRTICLGDIVGYGPSPKPVLESVYTSVHHFVLGNHDAALCGKLDADCFNESARKLLDWTRSQLGRAAIRFFDSLPLSLAGEGFRCAHGDFSAPGQFNYVIDPPDALPSWKAVPESLLFVGHSHRPGLYLLGRSGTPHLVPAQDFALEEGKRFLVNVGSVGQPRDGDTRASYCIFDAGEGAVYWRRIPFDLDAYRVELERQGLPSSASYFLSRDPRAGVRPLREILSFSPPESPKGGVTDAVEVQDLKVLQGRVKKWRAAAVALLALLLASAAAGAMAWGRHASRTAELAPPIPPAAVVAADAAPGGNLLTVPAAPSEAGAAIEGWTVRLGDRRRQSVEVKPMEGGGELGFSLKSASADDELRLVSPEIVVEPETGFTSDSMFRRGTDFVGTVAVVISLVKTTDAGDVSMDQFMVKEPAQKRQGGWQEAKKTFLLPSGAKSLRFEIRGRFTGGVEIKGLSLTRK